MRVRSTFISLLSVTAILWLGFSSCVFAEDVFAMKGEFLSEQEMTEARGGFLLPSGDFLYFSMDLLKLDFLSHSEPVAGSSGWTNALSQRVTISESGEISVGLDALQSVGNNSTGETAEAVSSAPSQIDIVSITDSFRDFTGIGNANIITGNHNTASIINVLNVRVGFFSMENRGIGALRNFLQY